MLISLSYRQGSLQAGKSLHEGKIMKRGIKSHRDNLLSYDDKSNELVSTG